MKTPQNLILKITNEMATSRAKIIDDFIKTFIASRWEDYFSKQKKLDFKRIELVEKRESPLQTTYSVRLKKGKL